MSPRGRIVPDDEKSESPGLYVAFGLASLVLIALGLASLVVPPALAAHLAIKGARAERPLLAVAGAALFAVWFAALVVIGRRVMSAHRHEGDGDGPEDAGGGRARD